MKTDRLKLRPDDVPLAIAIVVMAITILIHLWGIL